MAGHDEYRVENYGAYHQGNSTRTPRSEFLFMTLATLAMVVGLPVMLAVVFEYVVPLIGRLWG